jgi:type I restriction enzyme S subunit
MTPQHARTVPLGEVVALDVVKVAVDPSQRYRIAGVKIAGEGLFAREELRGADTTYPKLHQLRAGQLVYRKLTAWEGPITVVPPNFDGYFVSPEFPTFTPDSQQIDSGYLALLCRDPRFHLDMRALCTGTAERRNRLKPADLLTIAVALPSLENQREIVAAGHALEQLVEATRAEAAAAIALFVAARDRVLDGLLTVALNDLLDDIVGGRSPQAEPEPPARGERGVLKVSSIRPGHFDARESKVLPHGTEMPARAEVRKGDLLISRANTPKLVGSVCRVRQEVAGIYLSDKTLRLVPKPGVDPDLLEIVLAAPDVRQQIELAAGGSSSSMQNISQSEIRELEVPWPATTVEEDELRDELLALLELRRATAASAVAASGLGAGAVALLISGAIRVPDEAAA